MTHFDATFLGVQHDLRLFSRVGHNAHSPLSVGQVGTLQEQLVLRIRKLYFSIDVKSTVECVQIFVGQLDLQVTFDLVVLFEVLKVYSEVFLQVFALNPFLQVLLTVERTRLNKAIPVV